LNPKDFVLLLYCRTSLSGRFPAQAVFSRQREFSYGGGNGLPKALEKVSQEQRKECWAIQALQLPQMAAMGQERQEIRKDP
jgi:hypothetical protein